MTYVRKDWDYCPCICFSNLNGLTGRSQACQDRLYVSISCCDQFDDRVRYRIFYVVMHPSPSDHQATRNRPPSSKSSPDLICINICLRYWSSECEVFHTVPWLSWLRRPTVNTLQSEDREFKSLRDSRVLACFYQLPR